MSDLPDYGWDVALVGATAKIKNKNGIAAEVDIESDDAMTDFNRSWDGPNWIPYKLELWARDLKRAKLCLDKV